LSAQGKDAVAKSAPDKGLLLIPDSFPVIKWAKNTGVWNAQKGRFTNQAAQDAAHMVYGGRLPEETSSIASWEEWYDFLTLFTHYG
jgi:hypothetical protein